MKASVGDRRWLPGLLRSRSDRFWLGVGLVLGCFLLMAGSLLVPLVMVVAWLTFALGGLVLLDEQRW